MCKVSCLALRNVSGLLKFFFMNPVGNCSKNVALSLHWCIHVGLHSPHRKVYSTCTFSEKFYKLDVLNNNWWLSPATPISAATIKHGCRYIAKLMLGVVKNKHLNNIQLNKLWEWLKLALNQSIHFRLFLIWH